MELSEEVKKASFNYRITGPGLAEHNYLCAVCLKKPAVLYMNQWILMPCWECQQTGFHLVKVNKVVLWLLRKLKCAL